MFVSNIRRNIFYPLYFFSSQSNRIRYLNILEEIQYLSRNIIEEIQWKRLLNFLHWVWLNNKYYRDRFAKTGIDLYDIKSIKDFQKLPILSKKEIRENTESMVSCGYKPEGLLKFKTGGSTGTSLTLYITEACSEMRNACAWRHDRWSGWEIGDPIGAVWGNPPIRKSIRDHLNHWLFAPYIWLDTMHLDDVAVIRFAREWKTLKPTQLFGHAHSIYILSQYIARLGITEINPKGIISTSMMLMPHERKYIESVFGNKVFNRYGCEEVSLIASECEKHEGLHLNNENLFVEIVRDDGSPALPGEPGKIVVTDFVNRAMPFIRYSVEDVGVLATHSCSCGRGLPLLSNITGRVADFLLKADGSKVAGVSLIENTLTKIAGIEQMQIIQNTINNFRVVIVPTFDFSFEHKKALKKYIIDLFGVKTKVEIESVKKIMPEINGKYRFSICNISS